MELSKLKAPFPVDKVSWRVGARTKDKTKAIPLAYIDARDVMERLDEVCGVGRWQARYTHVGQHGVVCELGILTVIEEPNYEAKFEWIWKANGAGESDIEATKGAMSDAFKRAAVLWGIGRYLYDVPNIWVEIDQWGKIKDHEQPKLDKLLGGAKPVKPKLTEEQKKAKAEDFVCGSDMGNPTWVKANQAGINWIAEHYPEMAKDLEDMRLEAARYSAEMESMNG